MSRSPEEIKKWHDRYYDADIYKAHTDLETFILDFASDAIFTVWFWDREDGKWQVEGGKYRMWQTVELPSGDILIGWRPWDEEGLCNTIDYRLLQDCQITYYVRREDED